MNLLILGGTTEASAIARALAHDTRFNATISLAGRTRHPAPQPLPCRVGGFGGAEGLARYLTEHRIGAVIDATHPFATRMTRNAEDAARLSGTRLLVVWRPPWRRQPSDIWIDVPDMAAAAEALGPAPRRVLLTIGQKDLAAFAAAPWHHYVLRSVDPPAPDALPHRAEVIAARGPFAETAERDLLVTRRIEVLVTKNSGGGATEGKLAAARVLGLPVVMVSRPPPPDAETVATADEALAWIERLYHAQPRRGA
ncbi:MAG: cobalt-precorrin-6A reductase [Acetobacteraceae bacterium]|nr:cobalt-precorrin-6A reductase [Acetobacteraceae bacterium]